MDRQHIDDQTLEQFSMGTLRDPMLSMVEEHYLVCHQCQDQVAVMDRYITAVRRAGTSLRVPQPPEHWFSALLSHPFRNVMVPAAALAAVLVIVMPRAATSTVGFQTVRLESMRGAPASATALAKQDLRLDLDLRGLEGRSSYLAEVVTHSGDTLWSGRPEVHDLTATVPLGRSLNAGRYWIRLYSNEAREEMLREYGLTVE